MDESGLSATMTDNDFMLHLMGNLLKECETTLTDLENCFYKSVNDKLTIRIMSQKLNASYEQMQKKQEQIEEEKHWQ